MTDDHAFQALEATKDQLGAEVPIALLKQILEIEKKYAFDREEVSSALREIEIAIDAEIRGGQQP